MYCFFNEVIFVKEEAPKDKCTRVKLEIDRYKSETPCSFGGDPLNWWRDRVGSYPLLSAVAAKYLMIPATSVPSERVFSCAGNVVTKKRSALNPDNVNMLIFLDMNYKL